MQLAKNRFTNCVSAVVVVFVLTATEEVVDVLVLLHWLAVEHERRESVEQAVDAHQRLGIVNERVELAVTLRSTVLATAAVERRRRACLVAAVAVSVAIAIAIAICVAVRVATVRVRLT